MVPEILSALEHDLLVVVKLVAATAGTSLKNRARVVVPLQPGVRLVPVDGPAKVTRVDVRRQTLLVTVELVANEVHLASQRCMITLSTQVVCVGGDIRANLSSIVVSTNLHRQKTRDHAHAGGGAEGRRAVCRIKLDGRRGQAVQVGCLDLRVGVVHLELGSSQLVCHDVEDVGLRSTLNIRWRGVDRRRRKGVEIGSHGEKKLLV